MAKRDWQKASHKALHKKLLAEEAADKRYRFTKKQKQTFKKRKWVDIKDRDPNRKINRIRKQTDMKGIKLSKLNKKPGTNDE